MGGWTGERRGFDDWRAGEMVVEDGLAVGFEDGFGGHVLLCLMVVPGNLVRE